MLAYKEADVVRQLPVDHGFCPCLAADQQTLS